MENATLIEKGKSVFARYLKPEAVDFCVALWLEHTFFMKVTKSRKSVRGNFIFDPKTRAYTITVNGDLNPFSFLFTFLHELAHLVTHKKHGNKVLPHGEEWKKSFSELLILAHSRKLFPDEMNKVLNQFLMNPKASVNADHGLEMFLSSFDKNESLNEKLKLLSQIPIGSVFVFQHKKYVKLETKRTRVLCEEKISKKKFLISGIAKVEIS
ncbi:MAG: ImmA/IrrE family metallo-endopeptidase [Cytophagales bacterium]